MGLTVLDAGVIIGFLDGDDAHHEGASTALDAALKRNDTLVLPVSAFAEIMVGPSKKRTVAIDIARSLVHRVPIRIEPLDEDIALAAAALRAVHKSLKLPDALVIATQVT